METQLIYEIADGRRGVSPATPRKKTVDVWIA